MPVNSRSSTDSADRSSCPRSVASANSSASASAQAISVSTSATLSGHVPSRRSSRPRDDQTGRRYRAGRRWCSVYSLAEAAVQTIPGNPLAASPVAPWRLAKGGPARATGTTSPPRQSHCKRQTLAGRDCFKFRD
jgi:hypothetical protein